MKYFRVVAEIAAIVLPPCACIAQDSADYPNRIVRVIVSAAAGGSTDIQARMAAQKLSENLNRQFVVENYAGAGSTLGYGVAARAAPDGYTLLSVPSTFTFASALRPDLPDPVKDYVPISLLISAPYLLLAHPAMPARSVRELIALARSRPNVLNMGITNGSITHLAAAYFTSEANIKVTFVPYKGSGQVMVDTMAGQIDMFFANGLLALPQVKAGRLRALGVSTIERSPALPQIPTIGESGVRGYDVSAWNGWVAPARTPSAIINKLSAELAKAIRSPDIAKKLADDGGKAIGSTPEQFQKLIATEVPRWGKIVKATGMRME